MTISEMWETWRTDGIFLQFNAPPWAGENATALNNMYYLRILNKPISAICDSTVAVYPNDFKTVLTDIITSYYYDKWRRLWDNYHFNYNLMSNYSMSETGNNSNSGSTSNNNTITKKGTETNNNTKNLTTANTGTETTAQTNTIKKNEQDTNNNTANTTNSANANVYGFNTTSAVPTDNTSGTASTTGTQTTTHTAENTDSTENTLTLNTNHTQTGTDNNTITYDTQTGITNSGTNSKTANYEKTITGNTGAKYPCEVLEQERRLWLSEFFATVFTDIDRILTLPIYERK